MTSLQQLKNTLAKRILKLRKENYISSEDFSIEANISEGTISQLENAQHNVTLNTLYAVATYFHIPLSELLREPIESESIRTLRDMKHQIEGMYILLENMERFLDLQLSREEEKK